jgi:transposase
MRKSLMAGIDLHSNNVMIGIIDEEGRRIRHQKLECHPDMVVEFLRPYQRRLQSVAVESTYNWYWLVDGLRAAGYPVALANPAKIEQYSGIKT